MTVNEDKLRMLFILNIITKIVDKQAKKLNILSDTRDCCIDHVSRCDKSRSNTSQARQTNARPNETAVFGKSGEKNQNRSQNNPLKACYKSESF